MKGSQKYILSLPLKNCGFEEHYMAYKTVKGPVDHVIFLKVCRFPVYFMNNDWRAMSLKKGGFAFKTVDSILITTFLLYCR